MIKVKIRDKYRGFSHQELLDKAYELGSNFEKYSIGCSQCTVAAIHELLDIEGVVVRVASSLAGGTAMQFVGTCGALSGGVMILDYCLLSSTGAHILWRRLLSIDSCFSQNLSA